MFCVMATKMEKKTVAVIVACLAAVTDAATVIITRREESSQTPLNWRQILGVAIGSVAWVVCWIFSMKWLIRWNRRKRKEIEDIKIQLERERPGLLAKEGISPPSREQEKTGVFRQLLCPCLSCLPCGPRGSPTSPTPPGPPQRDHTEPLDKPLGPEVTEEKAAPSERLEEAPAVLSKTPPLGAEPPEEQPESPPSASATPPPQMPTSREKAPTATVNVHDRTLRGHKGRIGSLAFSHDSQLVASASNDKTIKIWDLKIEQCRQTLIGHSGWVRSVVFSHDSQLLVSGSEDDTVRVWSTEAGECQQILRGDGMKRVWSVALSHDSTLVASASSDGCIRVWETVTGECKQKLFRKPAKEAWAVAFTQDPQNSCLLVSALSNGTIEYWDAATGQRRQVNGIYDPDSDQPSPSFLGGFLRPQPVTSTASPTSWDVKGDLPGSTWSVAFSSDLRRMVSVPPDSNTAELFDIGRQCLSIQDFQGHNGSQICSTAMSRDSELLAAGSKDCVVNLWHSETGRLLRTLEGHSDWVSSVAFSHDSKVLASGSEDCTVKLWDIAKHSQLD